VSDTPKSDQLWAVFFTADGSPYLGKRAVLPLDRRQSTLNLMRIAAAE
jgi:hypothetical protein